MKNRFDYENKNLLVDRPVELWQDHQTWSCGENWWRGYQTTFQIRETLQSYLTMFIIYQIHSLKEEKEES